MHEIVFHLIVYSEGGNYQYIINFLDTFPSHTQNDVRVTIKLPDSNY